MMRFAYVALAALVLGCDAGRPLEPGDPVDPVDPPMQSGVVLGTPDPAGSWEFARTACGGNPASDNSSWCTGLEVLTLFEPKLRAAEGPFGPGSRGTIEISLGNPGTEHVNYPCVGFATDTDAVTIDGPLNPAIIYYAVLGGMSNVFTIGMQLDPNLPHGTKIRFASWVDALNAGCSNGTTFYWTATVP